MERRLSSVCDDRKFDVVMEKIGYNGRFQSRFNIFFNFVLVTAVSMPYLNIILALSVPEHWCHVPGRNQTNFTIEEWKNLTLPKEIDTRGRQSVSKCFMYNSTFEELLEDPEKISNVSLVGCQYGWEFDRTWYTETAPSQGEWVCEKELYINNAFAFGRIGDVVGTFIFGQLGDTIGRKPVFFLTLILLITGRCMSAFTWHNYTLFTISIVIGSLPSTAVFQSPLVIAMEISHEDQRSHIALLQNLGWTLAMCGMPMILWALGHWFTFVLVTTLPCALYLLTFRSMIESPRWLASQGKVKKCVRILHKIAKVNGTKLPADAMLTLRKNKTEKEKAYGIMSLFSSIRLSINTILLLVCWVNSAIVYYVLVLNVNALGGNPYLNFFLQGIAEFPAYLIARIFCDRIGRRWTEAIPFVVCGFACIGLGQLVTDPELEMYASILVVVIKFSVSFVFYVAILQTVEIYPTCVRQSGIALGAITANALGIFGPYIVYLGTAYDARYPYLILALLSFMGGICSSFLPETLHQNLPETLAEAQVFGINQKYFSIPKKREDCKSP